MSCNFLSITIVLYNNDDITDYTVQQNTTEYNVNDIAVLYSTTMRTCIIISVLCCTV